VRKTLVVEAAIEPLVRLRSINRDDLEDLRKWKNSVKEGFFFKGEINEIMQKAWFADYHDRKDDYMFIVEHDGKNAGCMGFRLEKGRADVYNVIASPWGRGKGLLAAGMRLMCSYIASLHTKNIGCVVVKGNPAIEFYDRCGFWISGSAADRDIMTLNWDSFRPVKIDQVDEKDLGRKKRPGR
jgi:ribosomal protein S18 acetylase RimI-like enzyme